MKILILSLAVFNCFLFIASAQESTDPVLLNVVYKTVHVNDTNHRDQPLVETMLLQVGQSASKYIRESYKPRPKQTNTSTGPVVMAVGRPMAVVNGPGITDIEMYQYPATRQMNITARLGMQDYLIEGKLPAIDWQITNETRQIDAYTCQKATGSYAGRIYTAWFTSELPFQCGPWKLSGLPGLILEAEDEKKEVQFLFKDMYKDSLDATLATNRKKLVKVTEKAYEKAREAFFENPVASMQAQLPPGAPAVELAYRDGSGTSATGAEAAQMIEKKKKEAKYSNNNPIELKKR